MWNVHIQKVSTEATIRQSQLKGCISELPFRTVPGKGRLASN